MKSKYDIFISYRRKGGYETAQLIAQYLKHQGYSVFFDLEDLRDSGPFNVRLLKVIESCRDFVVVFPPDEVERLANEDDWVRIELTCAIKHNKNIIPVLLRDFKFPKELPDDINEVRFYQGIAAGDYNYFDASMKKLRELLSSGRGITWQRYQRYFGMAIVLFILVLGVWGFRYWQGQKNFVATCVEQVKIMNVGVAGINVNLNTAREAWEGWQKFSLRFSSASPQDTADIRKDFLNFISAKKGLVVKRNVMETLSESSDRVLRAKGIQTEEIKAFYEMARPLDETETMNYLNSLVQYACMPEIFDSYNEYARQLYLSNEYRAKADYYSYLALLTTMPRDVMDTFKELQPQLNNFKEIPLSLTYDDYETQAKAMLYECERIISHLSGVNNRAQEDVEHMQYALKKTTEKMEQQILGDRLEKIEQDKAVIETRKAELAEADKRLTESYARALTKFTIKEEDDQWVKWGKMVRIATLANNALVTRTEAKRQYDEQVRIAKEQGLDPSFLTPAFYSVSLDEMFRNVGKWLDDYLKYHPSESQYVTSAKCFYQAVRKNKIPYSGVLVVATQNNEPHPVFRIGDIVVERKGKVIRNVDHYGTLGKDPAENKVKIIRFSSDGTPQSITETVPADCKVLVGMTDLTENE